MQYCTQPSTKPTAPHQTVDGRLSHIPYTRACMHPLGWCSLTCEIQCPPCLPAAIGKWRCTARPSLSMGPTSPHPTAPHLGCQRPGALQPGCKACHEALHGVVEVARLGVADEPHRAAADEVEQLAGGQLVQVGPASGSVFDQVLGTRRKKSSLCSTHKVTNCVVRFQLS